ncbi:MAG: manganese efflux pump MntP family protein [Anaerolineaceae bacterium]
MDFLSIFLIALSLAMDAFAVSLAIGTTTQCNYSRAHFRICFSFGFFQAIMPVLGWLAGSSIAKYIESFDHWIAFGLLAYIGISMIVSGTKKEVKAFPSDPSKGKMLITLAIATSIDALAVGLSMSMLDVDIILPSIVIGLVAMAMSVIGLHIGNRLGEKFGKTMQIIGGLILVFIGVRVLITHLL